MSVVDTHQPQIPRHVAVIMDGNGRWAKSRGHARWFGHVRGASRVKEVVKSAQKAGVKALTLFAFSSENWKRPDTEKALLWKLLERYLKSELNELNSNGVQLRVIGEVNLLKPELRALLAHSVETLSKNDKIILTLAISYGSRNEISNACKKFAEACMDGKESPEKCDESSLSRYLATSYMGDLSDVDLVIRTSGEMRMSNFLLWQAAYAEFVFFEKGWPEFSARDFQSAIEEFSKRNRRFGTTEAHS